MGDDFPPSPVRYLCIKCFKQRKGPEPRLCESCLKEKSRKKSQ